MIRVLIGVLQYAFWVLVLGATAVGYLFQAGDLQMFRYVGY